MQHDWFKNKYPLETITNEKGTALPCLSTT